MFYHIRFKSISRKSFHVATHQSVFENSSVILFGFDHFTSELYPFETFVEESIDVDGAGMNQHANGIAVASISIVSINIAF